MLRTLALVLFSGEAGIRHVWAETGGAHVWTVWRTHLADFSSQLFR